jgi:hypothetical protein
MRTVTNTELVDVAPVNTPAYTDATASARAFDDDLICSLARLKECSPTEIRNYLNDAGNVAKFFKRTDGGSAGAVTTTNEIRVGEGLDPVETEDRAKLSSAAMNDLPDSAFAYIEPGGKVVDGKTEPRSLRHFPIHDEAHIRNALSRAPQSPFGPKAMPKIKAAAKAHGIDVSEQNSLMLEGLEELRIMLAEMWDEDEEFRKSLPPWLQKAMDKKKGKDDDSDDEDEDDDKKSDDAKSDDKSEKKADDTEAEDRAKGMNPADGDGDEPEEDDDEDDSEAERARVEAEHQEMRDRLLRHQPIDLDLYDVTED